MPLRRSHIILLLCLTAVILTACGGDLLCPIPLDWEPGPGEDSIEFTFENQSCISICALWISPSSCDTWGSDVLPGNLPSGQSTTFVLPPGRYAINIEDCTQSSFIFEGIKLIEDDTFTITTDEADSADECNSSLTVINENDRPICYMWIDDKYELRSVYNWLSDEQILPGNSYTFILPTGEYDLRAADCDRGTIFTEMDVDIEGDFPWVVP